MLAKPAHRQIETVVRDLTFILRLGNHFMHTNNVYAFIGIPKIFVHIKSGCFLMHRSDQHAVEKSGQRSNRIRTV